MLFYNNGYIAYQHANLSQPIHYKKINIKIYITDKNKNIKESQCKSKKTYTINIPLTKPTKTIVWYPFPYRF